MAWVWPLTFGLCLLLLTGCSAALKGARGLAHAKGEIYLAPAVDPDANGNSPIAVDLVTIQGPALVKEVSKMTAQAWFQQKGALRQLHPGELGVISWEWVPGQAIAKIKIPGTGVADGVLLFANYAAPGPHSASLPRSGTVAVDFGAIDFQVLSKP